MMQKLMEINDHLVRTLAECEQLRSDQKTLQEICSIRLQRINELQEELRKVCAERDEADVHAGRLQAERDQSVENAARLHGELYATRKQLQDVCSAQSVRSAGQSDLVRDVSHYTEAAEVDTAADTPVPEYTPPEGWRVLAVGEVLQDGDMWVLWSHEHMRQTVHAGSVVPKNKRYIRRTESQPEPEYKPYTFAAYIVGDRIQPDALRIVWATEEWIEQSKFGIVHRMKDMQFFGNDGGCNITEYHETLTLSLKIQ